MSSSTPARRPVAIVTGASSGIGRAAARLLSEQGWDLVLAARSADGLADVAAECSAGAGQVLTVPTDVADRSQVEQLFATATEDLGRIDAVVHSAAVIAYGRFVDVPPDIFDRVVQVDVLGTANVARAAVDHFSARAAGKLVVIGSVLGKIAVPLLGSYSASKAAVHALIRSLQIEFRHHAGIGISLIVPGGVNTPVYLQAANFTGFEGRPPPPVDSPERVARAVLKVLGRSRRELSIGAANPLMVAGFRLFPALFDVLVTPLMTRLALSRTALAAHEGNVLTPKAELEQVHGRWSWLGVRRARPGIDTPR